MIPFNHLGWFFNLFSSWAYPRSVVEALCTTLREVEDGAPVLDLGAGTGIMSRYANRCRSGLRHVAADPSPGMLRYVPEYVESVEASAEALPFEDGSFAAVLLGEALHHFDDPRTAIKEITRVLRPHGVLFVYDFDPSAFIGRIVCLAEKLLGEPAHFYAPGALKSMLETEGFDAAYRRIGWRYVLTARKR